MTKTTRGWWVGVGVVALLAASPAAAGEGDVLVDAMRAEVERSAAHLRIEGYDAPYFLAARVSEVRALDVSAKAGALFPGTPDEAPAMRQAYVEVRVGDHDFDNFSNQDYSFNTYMPDFSPNPAMPAEDDPLAVRHVLWLMLDARYKEALSTFNRLRGERVYHAAEDKRLLGFARAPALTRLEPVPKRPRVDRKGWEARMKELSRIFLEEPALIDAEARFRYTRVIERVVNSQGTRTREARDYYEIHITAFVRAEDGRLIEHGLHLTSRDGSTLPDRQALVQQARALLDQLRALRVAPVLQPYTGPAILSGLATGVFFHETIGHRLEGERHNKEFEGKTFEEKIGQQILPEFLSLVDDPTQATYGGVQLMGHYALDEEGVPAREAVLIDGGVLKGYLMSRQTVEDQHVSNGHGRAGPGGKPMSRMGNLFVRSTRTAPAAEMKARLLEEVRRQGKPFGLIIDEIKGGDTNTSTWGYQAFRDVPAIVWRVDAQTGEATLVRGVEMVGTPLISLNRIVVTDDQPQVFNGHCGAESGYVPVSAIAPATLFSEIELQRSPEKQERDAILPPPWTLRRSDSDAGRN